MKKILLLLTLIFLVSFLAAIAFLSQKPQADTAKSPKILITTSFYPLYYLATSIGGQYVEVTNLTPPGVEPHDYEISSQDIAQMRHGQLLIFTGVLEPWAEKIDQTVSGTGLKVLNFRELAKGEDSHFWLDPTIYASASDMVTMSLVTIDPSHKEYYLQRSISLRQKLVLLDEKYRDQLRNCTTSDFVTSHAAFGYLANRYSLNQVPLSGLSAESESSLKQLAQITEIVRQKKLKVIFYENILSPKLSETIAKETGSQILLLNPLESLTIKEQEEGKDYLSIMEENLENLKIALQCR